MTAYPGVVCPRCDLRHELGLHKPHRPTCIECGADLPWPNLDRLAQAVMHHIARDLPMRINITGVAGLDPVAEDFLGQVSTLKAFLEHGFDCQFLSFAEDPLEEVAVRLTLTEFADLALALDRWHATGVGDLVTQDDLDRRCAQLVAAPTDPHQAQDLAALRRLQELWRDYDPIRCQEGTWT